MIDLIEKRETRLGKQYCTIEPVTMLALGAGAAGGLSGLFGGKKKTTEQFDRTRQYQFFSSPEQDKLRTELDVPGKGISEATSRFGGTYAALADQGEKFATGDYLDYNDPANAKFVQASTRPMERTFKEQTLPGMLSEIARGRGTGGSRSSELLRQTFRDYSESVGDVSSRALSNLAQMRTQGFQAAGSTMAALTDSATRLGALRASILPALQMTREYGVGSGTSTPSGQDQAQNALLQALVMYGGVKTLAS